MATHAAQHSPQQAATTDPPNIAGMTSAPPPAADTGTGICVQPSLPAKAGRRLLPQLCLAAVAFVLDQLSKWWAVGALTPALRDAAGQPLPLMASWSAFWSTLHPPAAHIVSVVDHFFHLRYVENPGAAWGFLARTESAWRTPFLAVVAVASMGVAVASLWGSRPQQRALRVGLALLLGGALGNLVDRVRLGYVIDFIDWHYYAVAAWPTFNIADACISVGAGLLLCDFVAELRRPNAAPTANKGA